MKLVKFEFLKVITNKLFLITFFLLACFNFLFLTYGGFTESKNKISYESYCLLASDLKDKSMQEKGTFINEMYERVYGISLIYNIQGSLSSENPLSVEFGESLREENKDIYNKYFEEAGNNPKFKYTGELYTELSLLEKIKEDYDKVNNYDGNIKDILNEAETLQGISIFSQTYDDISLKNIKRTTNIYESMLDTKIDFEIDKGFEKFTSVAITDFLCLIIIFIVATILITEEKEKNLFTIIKSTKNGGIKTIYSKIISLFLFVLITSIVFYGMNFLYYLITIGYGEFGSNIQGLSMFMLSTLKVNILEYIILFFVSKVLIFFLISCIIFYLAIALNNSSETIIGIILLTLISFIVYKGIEVNSNINLLKYFNLISLIDVNNAYQIYGNLQFGSLLFEKSKILMLLQIIFVVLFIFLAILKYMRSMSIKTKENILLSKISNIKIFRKFQINSVFGIEAYKLLFTNKVLIIILFFALFLGMNYKNENFNLSSNELFYKSYMEVLEGELTPEKEMIIEKARKEYEDALEQISKIEDQIVSGELGIMEGSYAKMPYEDILATRDTFARIEDKYEYIKNHSDAKFVYDTGYNKILRINNKVNESDIYLIVVTIVALTGLFVMEYKTGFIHILNATKKGRKITAKKKVLVSILVGTILYLISIVPEILSIYKVYGLNSLSSSIISIPYFEALHPSITILMFLILFYIVRYISYIMVILFILYIALKLKNQVFAFITASLVLLLPFLLIALKFIVSSPFPFLNLSWIVGSISRIIFIPIIVIIVIFLYNRILKRLE